MDDVLQVDYLANNNKPLELLREKGYELLKGRNKKGLGLYSVMN